ncbi:MAG: BREX-1 system adenine-specific DNA-methyltransferase PglX [Anaerobutyricum hallii]|uniref:BREX-1 system adenine-specific DNA-methyltransferase PglX n=1 Tax=Anaerobutyricum hallii TaxID=39488 RepID=UPI00242FA4C0|nr:BREX-1 system adenine-specific DNA-methyltransferase PglX [Anaerobutyricum hallii]MDD6587443.1 BREX-1 system adenine-specific DNA-methyltransferase PglX [Anaerobutyricum hallii]
MDKNAIKKFAVWARTELIARVSLKGVEYGITEDNIEDANADSVGGKVLTADEKKQRQALIAEINDKGYKQVMEEVAYTWFNRFSALRFMEVNGYLPSHVRVFTDEENKFKPQIITEAIHLDLDGLDMEKVYELKDAEKTEELYKYLLIVQCNALNKILPGMFQKIADYTELLLPGNLLREGSVIQQMIELIPEDDWKDAVQIIGWLYQYYNSEKKDDVFAALKKNVKITKENIPAATQLFTPDWIVRYMVENSLGRLWLEGHPDVKEQPLPTEEKQSAYAAGKRDPEDTKWHYYLEEAEQEPEVQAQLAEIRKEYAALTPDQLKVIDPCSGSGHILAYMFDVLMKIYESYGYTTCEAVASIVENNLYGLDIDDRAAQLAYFAVMMKARQYDRRFFSRGIQPHVYAIVESNHVDKFAVDYFCNGDMKLTAAMDTIIKELHDAKEYGSILTVTPQDWSALYDRFAEITEDINMSRETALRELLPLVQVAEALAQKYDVVVTNPPYMGASGMSMKLSDFVKKNYPDSKSDLFAVCIERGNQMVVANGINCMVTMQSWMFLSSFEKMRINILQNKNITNLMHMENMVMGIAFGTAVTAFRNCCIDQYKGTYNHVKYEDIVGDTPKEFPIQGNRFAQISTDNFSKIPGSPVAYWLSDTVFNIFATSEKHIGNYALGEGKNVTTNNARYILFIWEVSNKKIGAFDYKWLPCAMGGERRKWYGNIVNVIDWSDEARTFYKKTPAGRIIREEFWGLPGVTWGKISSGSPSFRILEQKQMYQETAVLQRNIEDSYFLLTILNTKISEFFLKFLAPTVNFQLQDICAIPVPKQLQDVRSEVTEYGIGSLKIAKRDWDSFETSLDFQHHPLLRKVSTIAEAFEQWQTECDDRFNQLKANEEELNRILIDIYGLQDELTPEVEDKDVTVRKADLGRDIRSFISYAVGCMFGRYSLDVDGLAYAGGEWDASKYASFAADKDNIIPICDDEYFEDDIVGLFVEFVKTVYGADMLDENLKFIADALGGKGQPKDIIRNYFLNDFYKDHCRIYQKRPIYWLFDSGKKNGFKALIYMHRYQLDTIARIRTDYVHEQQARYRTAIADLEQRIANASTGERVKLKKKLTTLQAQDTEIRIYEEKIHHLADQMVSIDLDDGVKKNYAIFQDVLAKIK